MNLVIRIIIASVYFALRTIAIVDIVPYGLGVSSGSYQDITATSLSVDGQTFFIAFTNGWRVVQ